MIKHNQDDGQRGGINILLIPFVLALLVLIGAIAFGGWAYSSRQDYKDNTDQKIATAVQVSNQKESSLKDAQFAEAQKSPLKSYNGPEAYGSMIVSYPKTWSGYVDDTGSGGALVDGFFNPGVVPSISNQNSTFALRVQVMQQSYSQTLQNLQDREGITTTPYKLPKVPNVVGIEVNGQIQDNVSGVMVVLPLRSDTLEIYTEGTQYVGDFNTYILPNFSFSP